MIGLRVRAWLLFLRRVLVTSFLASALRELEGRDAESRDVVRDNVNHRQPCERCSTGRLHRDGPMDNRVISIAVLACNMNLDINRRHWSEAESSGGVVGHSSFQHEGELFV